MNVFIIIYVITQKNIKKENEKNLALSVFRSLTIKQDSIRKKHYLQSNQSNTDQYTLNKYIVSVFEVIFYKNEKILIRYCSLYFRLKTLFLNFETILVENSLGFGEKTPPFWGCSGRRTTDESGAWIFFVFGIVHQNIFYLS